MDSRGAQGLRQNPAAPRVLRSDECYCEEVFFFVGQAAEEDEQQQPLCAAVHFLVIGQGFFAHGLSVVVHPVNPMVARQTMVRRVESDFIIA